MTLPITFDHALRCRKGDFNAFVWGGALVLPECLRDMVVENDLDALGFFSFVSVFPGDLATTLGWTHEEVGHALGLLAKVLEEHGVLGPPTPTKYPPYGALPPRFSP